MMTPALETKYRKKLIEVALPLEAISAACAEEKSVPRRGHPATLHLWWARRPLAAARAILFSQLVDDPSAWPERFPTEEAQECERKRLFAILEAVIPWEASQNAAIIQQARLEIARSWARNHPSKEAERVLAEEVTEEEIAQYLETALPPVHDPFAGGGTIPLEAQRLGLKAIATDLNPVAVLINKALIEIPTRFAGLPPVNPDSRKSPTTHRKGKKQSSQTTLEEVVRPRIGAQGLAEDVRYYGAWIRAEAERRIGALYPKIQVSAEMAKERPDLKDLVGKKLTVIAWLWARTVASPDPAFARAHVPLASTFWLSTQAGKECWVEPIISGSGYRFVVRTGTPADREAIGSGTKEGNGGFRCLLSRAAISFDYVRAEGSAGQLGSRLLAIVAEGVKRRVFLSPDHESESLAATAEPPWVPEGELPMEALGFRVQNYGLRRWADLFTQRQLVALTTFSDLVLEAKKRAAADARTAGLPGDGAPLHLGGRGADAYGSAITTCLAFCVSKLADYNSTLCGHIPGYGKFRSTFARQTLPMTWDFAELNPLGEAVGNWNNHVEWVSQAIQCAPTGLEPLVQCADATSLTRDLGDRIFATDPPYYDNIGYADLSDFFYVWLRRALRDVFPDETSTLLVPKQAELVATPYRHGGKEGAERFFLEGMTRALASFSQASRPEVPTTIYYAFKQSETGEGGTTSTGWETFLEAVLRAGFEIHGTWPVRTERAGRSRDVGSNALASSIVLACVRKPSSATTITRTDFRRILRQELPAALRALLHGNVAPVDVAQASIGPGMAIFSHYARVLEADGRDMTVRSALQLINEVLDEHLAEQEGELDPDSRFAMTWYENRGFDAGPYGEAETLAKARAVAVDAVAEAGILKSGGGKVRLLKRGELPDDWDPANDKRLTIWEATQHLIKRLEGQGEEAAAALLAKLGPLGNAARDLAYRLYSACEHKGWAEEARAYNGLVVAWPDLERLASRSAGTAAINGQQQLL